MSSTDALPEAYASLSLKDKVVLITGGSSGIGAATVRLFASRGAMVVLAARREAESTALVQSITSIGGRCTFVPCDVTREADIEAAVAACVRLYGRLDVAFNNAGAMGPLGLTHLQSAADVKAILDLNVTGVYLCMKYEVAQMLAQQKAESQPDPATFDHHVQPNAYYKALARYSIVNNASIFGQVGVPQYSAYAACKHAVIGMTKSASGEYAKAGIRVNAVNYGCVVTEITAGFVDYMLGKVPVGRLGQGVEAAECVAFLASDASSYVTGASLTCDGGMTACGL